MKLKKFKTINYENLKSDAKKCLSPITKKKSKQIITLNAEKIKENFHSYDLSKKKNKNKTIKLIEENKEFKHQMNKYYSYKNFLDKKDKFKPGKLDVLDILKRKYFKKRYKIPNFSHNIFNRNPLNCKGLDIREYFNELYRKNKKKNTLKEKNLDFLCRLQEYIKNEKSKDKSPINDVRKSLFISPKRKSFLIKEKVKNIELSDKKEKLKNYKTIWNNLNKEINKTNENKEKNETDKNNENNENKEDIEKLKNRKILRSSIFKDANFIYQILNEEDEDFKDLNEYEKNHMIKLIQEEEYLKDYKKFINKAVSDNNFFQVIDSIDLEKGESENNTITNTNLKKQKININSSIPNIKRNTKSKISYRNSEENSFSSENPKILNNQIIGSNLKKLEINNENQKIKDSSSRNIKLYPSFKKSMTLKNFSDIKISHAQSPSQFNIGDINKKNFLTISINKFGIKGKRLSYSIKQDTVSNFLKTINENETKNKNNNNNNDLNKDIIHNKSKNNSKIFNIKQNNILNYRDKNTIYKYKNLKKETKEENLNNIFSKLIKEKNLSEEFVNEFKKYYMKKKNISEYSINKFINKKYEFNDFVNFCSSLDKKVKEGNIKNKWKRNYLRIGKFEKIKSLLDEEEKQDHFINHFLQNYINSMNGKRSFYGCDSNNEFELI